MQLKQAAYTVDAKLDYEDLQIVPLVDKYFGTAETDDYPATGLLKAVEDKFISIRPKGVSGEKKGEKDEDEE